MSEEEKITAEELRETLDYDPETGEFKWRVSNSNRAPRGSTAGCPHNGGYVQISVRNHRYLAHRLAWLHTHGAWPPDQIDHVNGDRADNRLENLRLATGSQNLCNQRRRSNNTSGIKGVSWYGPSNKWKAQIKINGKQTNLGHFNNIEDAAAAYRSAALEHYGGFANTGDAA